MTDRARPQYDYFPLFFWDFEKDTEHMSDPEKMGYLRILAHMYKSGGFIADDLEVVKKLARFTGKRNSQSMADNVYKLLIRCVRGVDENGEHVVLMTSNDVVPLQDVERLLTQSRVVKTIEKIQHIQKVNKERATKAAHARWGFKNQK